MKSYIVLCLTFLVYTSLSAVDYYWVGGSGDWSDISHWKTTSGGVVGHSQAPGPQDDVYFDQNSFTGPSQVVTLNTDIIFCKSIDWSSVTNNPTLQSGEQVTMSIYGNLALSTAMNFDFRGRIILSGSDVGRTVDFASHSAGPHLQIDGSGAWSFESRIEVDSMLEILMGEVDFNSQDVSVDHLYIRGVGMKTIDLKNSQISINGAFLDIMYVDDYIDIKSCVINTDNLNLNAGTSKLTFTAKDPALWFEGSKAVALNNILFEAATGNTLITDWYSDLDIEMNELVINSNAKIDGRITIGTLGLNGGSVYAFESNQTYKLSEIIAAGTCAEGVIITSIDNGVPSTFSVASGNIDLDFLTLRDIHTAGGASFTANNGVDLGNNDGWTFTNSTPQDFYWIGGTGIWSDPTHWSFSSGGASSGCVPTGKDDVFFDQNSFSAAGQTVNVDKENIYVHDMTWNMVLSEPSFTGSEDSKVRITGSLVFDANMSNDFMGDVYFESGNAGNEITMNGKIFNSNLYFSGIDGSWTFQDAVEVNRTIFFFSGTLLTNGKTATCTRFLGESDLRRTLDISDSYVNLRGFMDEYPYLSFSLNRYTLIADNSTIEFTGGYSGSIWHYGEYETGSIPRFNKVIFSNYFGTIGVNNYIIPVGEPMQEIDSLIFNTRGEVFGSNRINVLQLASGYDYAFDSYNENYVQEINDIKAAGTCGAGPTKISGHAPGSMAQFRLNSDITLERMDIQDLAVIGSGSLTANNSIDGGRTQNIAFTDLLGRTLYWVGDGGNWEEEIHWSLSSGGPGGECIPTSIDNVIFDTNSFSMPNQYVGSNGGRYRYCHDITWTGTSNMPEFGDSYLIVSGSVNYDNSFRNYVWQHIFTSSEDEEVYSKGQTFSLIILRGSGQLAVKDDMFALELIQHSGSLVLDNINASFDAMYFEYNTDKVLDLKDSHVEVRGTTGDPNYPPFRDYSQGDLTILPGRSVIDFSGLLTGIFMEQQVEFADIVFSNPQADGYLLTHFIGQDYNDQVSINANSIAFNGNGNIVGKIETDTLIGAPGKTYILESGKLNKVERYLQMIGNNCTPIELRSSIQGQKATIEMPSTGRVLANFVQMQDNSGVGGANFNAGARSTNIGNSNTGWVFEDAPEILEAGFLGSDRALCTGEDLVLDAYSFSPNEQYLWNDGSMDSILVVNTPGDYFVEVQFQSSCILRDTIEIFAAQDIEAMLPAMLEGCAGEVLTLDAEIPISTAIYIWTDGSNEASLDVTSSGTYGVEIDVDGCVSSASSTVEITEDPGVDLGPDQSFCETSPIMLTSPITADNYLWQDGSTDATVNGIDEGTYWLEINVNGCLFRDSVNIDLVPVPIAELGQDTSICDNEALVLTIDNPNGYDITWQDGSSGNSINVTTEGPYVVTVDDNGCINKDTVEIAFRIAPTLDLGLDASICEGEVYDLQVPDPALPFTWNDGSTETIREITNSGIYTLEVEENNCFGTDAIEISVVPNPQVNLGQDTTVCDDVPFILSPITDASGIIWADGSTASTFLVASPGEVKVTVVDGNCMGSDSINVFFKECINFEAFIPTAFSPNQDGYNDQFEVFFSEGLIIESFKMSIYDRWGNEVFVTEEYGNFWDGTHQSKVLDRGVYTYFLNVSYIDDFGPDETSISGDITIMQ